MAGLHSAAATGDLLQMEQLPAAGVDVNTADSRGWNPLHCAAQANQAAAIALLAAARADVNAYCPAGIGPQSTARLRQFGPWWQPALTWRRGSVTAWCCTT